MRETGLSPPRTPGTPFLSAPAPGVTTWSRAAVGGLKQVILHKKNQQKRDSSVSQGTDVHLGRFRPGVNGTFFLESSKERQPEMVGVVSGRASAAGPH